MTTADASDAAADVPGALPVGTRLGEYELRGVIGAGGFGIAYLAFDHALEREVAIKEYMPGAMAARGSGVMVQPLSMSVAADFELGLSAFVDEGRTLARFDSPSLLKVYRCWEANGTAYITMPRYRGRTLKEYRESMPAPPDEAAARALLMPLLGALERLHRESIFHRDIAPDNILVESAKLPVLLDFGAARRVIGEKTQALTAILKPAYAPIEQYGEALSVKQGPWTDLYALGATMHYLLLGRAPPPSTARVLQDEMQPLAERGVPGCSPAFLKAIDWMLALRPTDRPQNVAALVEVLEGRAEIPPLPARTPAPVATPAMAEELPTQRLPAREAAPSPLPVDTPIEPPPPPSAPRPAPQPRPVDVPAVSGSRRLWLAGAAMLLAAAAVWWWFAPKPVPAAPPVATVALPAEPRAAPAVPPAPAAAAALPADARPMAQEPAPAMQPAVAAPPRPKAVEPGRGAAPVAAERHPPRPASAAAVRPPPRPAPQALQEAQLGQPAKAAQPAQPARADMSAPVQSPAASAVARAVKGPRERCGTRLFIALINCMNRECAKPGNERLPECELYRPPGS